MIKLISDEYNNFVCEAENCIDTCCVGFDIILDEISMGIYENYNGNMGKFMRSGLDVSRKMLKKDDRGKCFFLDGDRLCKLQKRGGEKTLCYTCRVYPRWNIKYDEIEIYGIDISCPLACKKIIDSDEMLLGYNDIDKIKGFREKKLLSLVEVCDNIKISQCVNDFLEYLNITILSQDEVVGLLNKMNISDTFFQYTKSVLGSNSMMLGKRKKNVLSYYTIRYFLSISDITDYKRMIAFLVSFCSFVSERDLVNVMYKFSREIEHCDTNMKIIMSKGDVY